MFENMFLATDLDGTLLTDDKKILDKDLSAINEFRGNGGLFTIATGRAGMYSRTIAQELGIDIPAVTINGASVYDYKEGRTLWQSALPKSARNLMLDIKGRFPTLGVDIICGEDVFTISSNRRSEEHFNFTRIEPIRCTIRDVPDDGWIKMLLVDEPEVIDEVVKYSAGLGISDVHVVCSSSVFFEILPLGANKWSGLRKLIDLAGFEGRFVVAVGDWLNDLEMVKMADLGVAVANALDEVKEHADLIVCDNNCGAIYEVIEKLKNIV